MSDFPSRIWVCLCQPNDIRNVAGAIRAVANFGLAGIKLVTGKTSLYTPEDLHIFSSGASEIVNLQVFEDLPLALAEASIVVGTSRRQRNHQHIFNLSSIELVPALYEQPAPHLLFGNERTGLSHGELDLCHAVVELPSSRAFPSLNLAHAVACVAYEIARSVNTEVMGGSSDSTVGQARGLPLASTSIVEDEAFLTRVIEVSERLNYPPGRSSERFARQLRSLLRRAHSTSSDYGLILGLFRELERLGSSDDTPGRH